MQQPIDAVLLDMDGTILNSIRSAERIWTAWALRHGLDNGKPAPDCFQIAAARLGTSAEKCLVLEDSQAGILAGERAGAAILMITATHHTKMENGHPGISGYGELAVNETADGDLDIRSVDTHPNQIQFLLKKAPSSH